MYTNFTLEEMFELYDFGMACPCYGDGLWFETEYEEWN